MIGKDDLAELLLLVLNQRLEQGCDLDKHIMGGRIEAASDSYDALYAIARELRSPPQRPDWPYVEPLGWEDIVRESAHLDPGRQWAQPDLELAAGKVRAAFLGSVCGCMLGKPIEVDPTLAELESAGRAVEEWPIRDYIPGAFVERLGRRHESSGQTLRENINFVAADDDIHYSIIGMLLLEEHGIGFGEADIYHKWAMNIPPLWTWGPERSTLLTIGINCHHALSRKKLEDSHDVLLLNPGDESCGALIRADAYGYACPGNPDLAAWLAWKDASFTHIKTGIYGAMFIAALIALCHNADSGLRGNERLGLVDEALKRVPANSRFSAVARDSLEKVAAAGDWLEAYEAIHDKYREYAHCRVYQEIGTLINSLKFAESIDKGFCTQVSQGNDTDSFGATSGSVLGAFFGPGYLNERWLAPFSNRINHALADFHEYDLDALANRFGRLPERVYREYRQSHDHAGTLSGLLLRR